MYSQEGNGNGQREQEVTSPAHYIFEQFQNSYQFGIPFTNPEKIFELLCPFCCLPHDSVRMCINAIVKIQIEIRCNYIMYLECGCNALYLLWKLIIKVSTVFSICFHFLIFLHKTCMSAARICSKCLHDILLVIAYVNI